MNFFSNAKFDLSTLVLFNFHRNKMVKGDLETMTIGSTSTARTNTVCLRNAKNSATETNNGVNIADISVEVL